MLEFTEPGQNKTVGVYNAESAYLCLLQSKLTAETAVSAPLSNTRFYIFIISLKSVNGLRLSAWETSYSLKRYSAVAIWEAAVVGEPYIQTHEDQRQCAELSIF